MDNFLSKRLSGTSLRFLDEITTKVILKINKMDIILKNYTYVISAPLF